MKRQTIARLFLLLAFLMQANSSFAFETDQYNLPPEPLADTGDEVSEYVEENLTETIEKINSEIRARQDCIENKRAKSGKIKCGEGDKERLAFLRTNEAIAREVYSVLGAGTIPFTKSGSWMESHRFRAQPARYKTSFSKSIFFIAPVNYLTLSSTVKLYDAQFGTDKIAHFFQQGYSYYKIYKRALINGSAENAAIKKAIDWGKQSEKTFYGTLVSGVYSNADLFANFAGMKFYINLAQNIKIGESVKSAILILENGIWKFNTNIERRENLIKPFVSNHLNEALNPSIFIPVLRSYIRRTVRKQSCAQWLKEFPDKSKIDFENATRELKLWRGEDYGYKESDKFITIANTCFSDSSAK